MGHLHSRVGRFFRTDEVASQYREKQNNDTRKGMVECLGANKLATLNGWAGNTRKTAPYIDITYIYSCGPPIAGIPHRRLSCHRIRGAQTRQLRPFKTDIL